MELGELDARLDACCDQIRALAATYPPVDITAYTEINTQPNPAEIHKPVDPNEPIKDPAKQALVLHTRTITTRCVEYAAATMILAECIEHQEQTPGLADHTHDTFHRVQLDDSVTSLHKAIDLLEAAIDRLEAAAHSRPNSQHQR